MARRWDQWLYLEGWSVSTPQIRYYGYHHLQAREVVKQLIGDDSHENRGEEGSNPSQKEYDLSAGVRSDLFAHRDPVARLGATT